MVVVSVMYPASADATFDMNYYLNTHMKMVEEAWAGAGLHGYRILHGAPGPDGGQPPYKLIANLDFSSAEAFAAAASGESGAKIMGDIPNFTNIQPSIQISEVAGSFST